MLTLQNMIYNSILNTAVLSWVAAQLLKFVFTLVFTGKADKERLLGAGGMPSSHSAMVCSLAIAVARSEGLRSAAFAISFVFACVVMYDAMGVRRQAGEQAKIINKMRVKNSDEALEISENEMDESAADSAQQCDDKELKEII
ncbi:MAG TPA: acid phosphatase, partial [Ruminococcaceae bacterium]|nr:acid phosphatase [Oscillospiraceae bacterium]